MPLNPDLPPPPVAERLEAAIQIAAYRHRREIEVITLGIALGVLIALTDAPLIGAMVALAYFVGAIIQTVVTGGK